MSKTPRTCQSPARTVKPVSLRSTGLYQEKENKAQAHLVFPLPSIRDNSVHAAENTELVVIDSFNDSTFLETISPSVDGLVDSNGSSTASHSGSVWGRLVSDQSHFYSPESMLQLGLAFGVGASFANTQLDDQLQNHFQSSVRHAPSEEWFQFLHANKELGNGFFTLPVFGAAWFANEVIDGPPIFETTGLWGERAMRGFLVGAPPLILMQHATGASRPYESNEGSEWRPFRDNNGVSGHAFMSSLPFITAAKLVDDPWKKTFWYTASALGPLSRVNDNAHYSSQVGLGWIMAYIAATAVEQSDTGQRGWTLIPQSTPNSSGIAMQYTW